MDQWKKLLKYEDLKKSNLKYGLEGSCMDIYSWKHISADLCKDQLKKNSIFGHFSCGVSLLI